MSAEARLAQLGLRLPPPPPSVGRYVPAVRAGGLLFVAGHAALAPDGRPAFRGKLGRDLDVEAGYAAARAAAVALLGTVRAELGSLDRVERVAKLLVMVNCDPGFGKQPLVADGASDLVLELFGEERGAHARSAVGMASLPFGIPVEVEAVLAVDSRP